MIGELCVCVCFFFPSAGHPAGGGEQWGGGVGVEGWGVCLCIGGGGDICDSLLSAPPPQNTTIQTQQRRHYVNNIIDSLPSSPLPFPHQPKPTPNPPKLQQGVWFPDSAYKTAQAIRDFEGCVCHVVFLSALSLSAEPFYLCSSSARLIDELCLISAHTVDRLID